MAKKKGAKFAERPHGVCYLEYSDVSCGVKQFYGFYDEADEVWDEELEEYVTQADAVRLDPATIFKNLCYRVKESKGENEPRSLVFGTLVFSDLANGPGTEFGTWLCEEFPNCPPARQDTVNPNSGRSIVTFLWTPTVSEVLGHEIWKNTIIDFERNRAEVDW